MTKWNLQRLKEIREYQKHKLLALNEREDGIKIKFKEGPIPEDTETFKAIHSIESPEAQHLETALKQTRATVKAIISPVLESALYGPPYPADTTELASILQWERLHNEMQTDVIHLLNLMAACWKNIGLHRSAKTVQRDNYHEKVKFWTGTAKALLAALAIVIGIVFGVAALILVELEMEKISQFLESISIMVGSAFGAAIALNIIPALTDWRKPPPGERALTQLLHNEADYYGKLSAEFENSQGLHQRNRWLSYQARSQIKNQNIHNITA